MATAGKSERNSSSYDITICYVVNFKRRILDGPSFIAIALIIFFYRDYSR